MSWIRLPPPLISSLVLNAFMNIPGRLKRWIEFTPYTHHVSFGLFESARIFMSGFI